MLRSGVTARRIGDARARDDSPATGDRRPRAPRTAHLPAVQQSCYQAQSSIASLHK